MSCEGDCAQAEEFMLQNMAYRVSNGTRQCNFLGQRDRSFFVVPGQRDKLKILPRDRTGQDSQSKSETGRGTGQNYLKKLFDTIQIHVFARSVHLDAAYLKAFLHLFVRN